MNNSDVPNVFLSQKVERGTNGRGNLKFVGKVLYSYEDVIALFHGDQLLVSGDTFSATSSRHQSAVKRAAGCGRFQIVPDLSSLARIFSGRDPEEIGAFLLRRKMAISELKRRIEVSRSDRMVTHLQERILQERAAAGLAIRYLPFDKALAAHRDFFR